MLIFDLASQHARWLAARQMTAASNIANANTPGYKALDVAPFEQTLEATGLALTITSPSHLQAEQASAGFAIERERTDGWDVTHSGNSVTLESELMRVGENNRMMALDANITRTFHRMLLASLKVT